jgi:hypothetical protein
MQRAPIFPGFDFGVGAARLFQRSVLHQGHDAFETGCVLFDAVQIEPGQFFRSDFSALEERGQFADGIKCEVIRILRHSHVWGGR